LFGEQGKTGRATDFLGVSLPVAYIRTMYQRVTGSAKSGLWNFRSFQKLGQQATTARKKESIHRPTLPTQDNYFWFQRCHNNQQRYISEICDDWER
jgi:hypothetical protein